MFGPVNVYEKSERFFAQSSLVPTHSAVMSEHATAYNP